LDILSVGGHLVDLNPAKKMMIQKRGISQNGDFDEENDDKPLRFGVTFFSGKTLFSQSQMLSEPIADISAPQVKVFHVCFYSQEFPPEWLQTPDRMNEICQTMSTSSIDSTWQTELHMSKKCSK